MSKQSSESQICGKHSKILGRRSTSFIHQSCALSVFLFYHYFFPGKSVRASCCFPPTQYKYSFTHSHWFISWLSVKGKAKCEINLSFDIKLTTSRVTVSSKHKAHEAMVDFRSLWSGETSGRAVSNWHLHLDNGWLPSVGLTVTRVLTLKSRMPFQNVNTDSVIVLANQCISWVCIVFCTCMYIDWQKQ